DALASWASRLSFDSRSLPGRAALNASKKPGPDLAHGSWFALPAALPPQASSRWAQISRDPGRQPALPCVGRGVASSCGGDLHRSQTWAGDLLAGRGVYAAPPERVNAT